MRLLPLILLLAVTAGVGAYLAFGDYGEYTDLPALAWEVSQGQCDRPDRITIDPALKLPRTAMVYRLKRIPVSEEQIRVLAKKLGLPDEPVPVQLFTGASDYGDMHYGLRIARDGSSGEYRAKSTGEVVRVHSDGAFSYHDARTESMEGPAPSEKKSKQIALDFLRRTGLLPSNARLTVSWMGGDSLTFSSADGTTTRDVRVSWHINVDIDYPLDSIHHSHAEMQVVEDGRVRLMNLTLPKVEPFRRYPLKDAEEILTAFRTRQAYWNTEMMFYVVSCEFKSVRVSYFRNRDDLIIPMYMLAGEVWTEKRLMGHPEPCWGRMAAVKPEYLLPWEPAFPLGDTILEP